MKRSTVASLAILKVNYERHGRDYIHNFVPFVVECLKNSPDDVVALPALQKDMQARFGLRLPLNPLRQILQRAAGDGYLRKEAGVYYRDLDACAKSKFSGSEAQIEQKITQVIKALQVFAQTEHKLDWTDSQSEDALLAFIGDSGLDILFAAAEASVLPQPKASSGAPYVVAAFVAACGRTDHDLFSSVETIIKGALLANALYLPDQGKIAQRFRRTNVYLDTTFLIYALGYAGEDRQAPCLELLELLKSYGAQLCCFQETLEEARGILDACAARMRRGELRDATGPTIEYFIARGLLSTDVDLMAARLPSKLVSLTINVHDRPAYDKAFVIDENGFEQHLREKIGYVRRPKALQHDVDCIAAIARLRAGRESFAVENCGAVFVTTNSELARATRAFFQAESTPKAVALCVTDYALSNLLWLKNPTQAPDLPRRRLIADAFAAMDPPETLWKAYLTEIARLEAQGHVTSEDYLLLRHSLAAKAALMDLTKGDPTAFTQGRVTEVLEVAKRTVRADLLEELAASNAERARQEADLAKKDEEHGERIGAVRGIGLAVGRVVSSFCFAAALVLLGLATLYTFPWTLPSAKAGWLRYALTGVQIALFIYVVASMGWGTTLRDLAKRLETRIAAAVEIRIRRAFRI